MDGFDLDTYQLNQQLLTNGTGAAAFFQPPPPPPQAFFQPPLAHPPHALMLDQWVVDPEPQGCSVLPQPPGGGVWAGNDGGFVPGGGDWAGSGVVAQGQAWAASGSDDVFLGSDQFAHGGGFPSLQDLVMAGVDLSKFDFDDSIWAMDSLAANQAAAHPSSATTCAPPMVPVNQPGSDSSSPSTQLGAAAESPGLTSQMPAYPPVVAYPQAPPKFVHGGGVPSAQDLLMSGVDLRQFDEAVVNSLWAPVFMNSLAANQAGATIYAPSIVPAVQANQPESDSSSPSTQIGGAALPGLTSQMSAYTPVVDYQQPHPAYVDTPQAGECPGLTPQMPAYQPVMDYHQPPPASVDTQQAVPDDEKAEVAQMVAVAVRCDDMVSTAWSEEENQVLREGLSRLAGQDNVTKCFNIASGLANKTVIDVAYRIRWLSDLEQKKRAAKQAQLEQEKSIEGKVTKGKGTKGATRKKTNIPFPKALNSKSTKDLIRDNDMLMDKIEEILKTGQVKDSADYFYYMKMNMDALQNKVTGMSTVMEGLSVDDEEWKDVLKDRHSLAGKDTAAPP